MENNLKSTDDLIDAVVEWGEIRGINNPQAQLNKVMEELGELAHEINRGNYESPKAVDAVGDTLVTLIILADIMGLNAIGCLQEAFDEIKDRKGHTEGGMFIKEENGRSKSNS